MSFPISFNTPTPFMGLTLQTPTDILVNFDWVSKINPELQDQAGLKFGPDMIAITPTLNHHSNRINIGYTPNNNGESNFKTSHGMMTMMMSPPLIDQQERQLNSFFSNKEQINFTVMTDFFDSEIAKITFSNEDQSMEFAGKKKLSLLYNTSQTLFLKIKAGSIIDPITGAVSVLAKETFFDNNGISVIAVANNVAATNQSNNNNNNKLSDKKSKCNKNKKNTPTCSSPTESDTDNNTNTTEDNDDGWVQYPIGVFDGLKPDAEANRVVRFIKYSQPNEEETTRPVVFKFDMVQQYGGDV